MMSGVSGGPEPKLGDEVEFAARGRICRILHDGAKVRVRLSAQTDGWDLAEIATSLVRVVVPPLAKDDVIDKAHREDLDRLPDGAIFCYVGDRALAGQQCWQKRDVGYRIPGSNTLFQAFDVTLPVRVLWVGE